MKQSLSAGALIACASVGLAPPANADVVTQWNARVMQCVQGGPTAANRAGPPGLLDVAIIQAAVHDAVQAIEGRYEAYHYTNPALLGAGSTQAAAANAAPGAPKVPAGDSRAERCDLGYPCLTPDDFEGRRGISREGVRKC